MNPYRKKDIKGICLILIGLLAVTFTYAQDKKIQVKSTITDQKGTPVENATVYGDEGTIVTHTGTNGQFDLMLDPSDIIRIDADGFESRLIKVEELNGQSAIILEKALLKLSQADVVNVPFGTQKKRQIVGAVDIINSSEIAKHDQSQNVYDALSGRVAGNSVFNARGLNMALVVIDGFPRASFYDGSALTNFDLLSNMSMLEIDQIVLLKDGLSRILYGAQANQPVLLITTKRGTPFKRTFEIHGERGIKAPRGEYPRYLNAADYMDYYNRALENDGLAPLYDQSAIDKTRSGTDPVHYPDQDYYNSGFLNDLSNFHRLDLETSGGNDRAQYYSVLTWNSGGDLYKIGEGANARNNQFNFRGNVDYKLNDRIKVRLDALADYGANKQPNAHDFWHSAGTLLPNAFPLLIPVDQVHDEDLLSSAKIYDGKYLFGGTDQYRNNMIANFDRGGYSTIHSRVSVFSTGLDFDLEKITEGLTANLYYSYNALSRYSLSYENKYRVYDRSYVPSVINGNDSLIISNYYDNDEKTTSQSFSEPDSYRSNNFYATLNYSRTFSDKHEISATVLGYWTKAKGLNVYNSEKKQHAGLRVNYMYNKRFVAELSGTYTGSGKLAKGNRYHVSPGFGLGWIISEEDFFNESTLISYMKLKTSYASIKTDQGITGFNLFSTLYSDGNSYAYNQTSGHSNKGRIFSVIQNPGLGFLNRNDFNVGIEAMLLNKKLWFEANYFISVLDGQIVRKESNYPAYVGVLPYENFEKERDRGIDLKIDLSGKMGDFRYSLGMNMTYVIPKMLKLDEVYDPEAPGLYMTGQPSDAIVGYVAESLFKDDADIDSHVPQFGLEVNPGDIKYTDLNDDGQINFKDQRVIGNSRSRITYGLTLLFGYKNWSLYASGTGYSGAEDIFTNSYYWINSNEAKYSVNALDYWTPRNASAAVYPRLSTGANSSNSNNFRTSTFWLEKMDVFNVQRAQLTYDWTIDQSWIKGLSIYLRGSNLATFSKIKDRLLLNPGGAPNMNTFALGCNLKF